MATQTRYPSFQPPAKTQSQIDIVILLPLVLAIAVICAVVAFIMAPENATGIGQAGLAALVVGTLAALGGLVLLVLRKALSGYQAGALIVLGLILVVLGLAGLRIEPVLHNNQGNAFKKTEDYPKAIQEYRKGTNSNLTSNLPETYLLMGNRLFTNRKYEESVQAYQTVLSEEFSPNAYSDTARQQIGQVYLAWGDQLGKDKKFEESLNVYRAGLSNQFIPGSYPNTARQQIGTTMLAWAGWLEQQGQPPETVLAKYDEVIKDGNNSQATLTAKNQARALLQRQGDAGFQAGNYDKALMAYQRAQQNYGDPTADGQLRNAIAKTHLAWAQQDEQAGNFEAALTRYRTVLGSFSEMTAYTVPASEAQPRVLFNWAGKQSADRQYEQAIFHYQEVINSYGGSNYAQQARNILAAPQAVTVLVMLDGKPLANTRVQLYEKWVFPTNTSKTFEPQGRTLDFVTDAGGQFTAVLTPGQKWLLGYYNNTDHNFKAVGRRPFNNPLQYEAKNLVYSEPLRFSVMTQDLSLQESI